MQKKYINGTRLDNLHKKNDLFRRREGEPRYTPQGVDITLESIRQKILSRHTKRK